jgi:hypothetical protein
VAGTGAVTGSLRPHPKVVSATTVAAVVTVGCWVAGSLGHTVPTEIQGAITTVLVGAVGYATPSG